MIVGVGSTVGVGATGVAVGGAEGVGDGVAVAGGGVVVGVGVGVETVGVTSNVLVAAAPLVSPVAVMVAGPGAAFAGGVNVVAALPVADAAMVWMVTFVAPGPAQVTRIDSYRPNPRRVVWMLVLAVPAVGVIVTLGATENEAAALAPPRAMPSTAWPPIWDAGTVKPTEALPE